MRNVLVIGEAPGRRMGSVLSSPEYERKLPGLLALRRVNLLADWPGPAAHGAQFPLDEAKRAAAALWGREPADVEFVLLGTRVASAFHLRRRQYSFLRGNTFYWLGSRRWVTVVPHPSGVNRWWNDPANREAAARFMSGLRRT